MIDSESFVVAVVRRVDAGRRTILQPILVGSARDRVAIRPRPACESERESPESII